MEGNHRFRVPGADNVFAGGKELKNRAIVRECRASIIDARRSNSDCRRCTGRRRRVSILIGVTSGDLARLKLKQGHLRYS